MKIVQELTPVSVTNPAPGIYVFDFGQNFVGWPRLNLDVPVPAGTILIKPRLVGDLSSAKGSYRSPQGLIRSEWTTEDDRFDITVEIPANTSATVWVPGVSRSEVPPPTRARFLRSEDGYAVYQVNSGVYSFASAGLAKSERTFRQ